MKSILLTSTALVAFAGAAMADGHATPGIGFAGEAELGYNDDVENGMYWSADLDVTATAALDNGVVATATFGLDIAEDNLGDTVTSGDYVLTLEAGSSKLTFGDTDPVAEDRYDGVDGATVADFNDQDVHFDVAGFEAMLVGETEIAGVSAAVSFGVNAEEGDLDAGNGLTNNAVDAMQIYVGGSFGIVDVELAYQEEFSVTPEIFAVAASTTVAGATVGVAYIDDGTENSIGIEASYPVGPVVLGGYYSVNDIAEDNYGVSAEYTSGGIAVLAEYEIDGGEAGADDVATTTIEGSYDVGNGLTVLAGYIGVDDAADNDQFYVAGEYDLGGGAELLVSYAEDEATAAGAGNDEIGDPEYLEGTTVAVSFTF